MALEREEGHIYSPQHQSHGARVRGEDPDLEEAEAATSFSSGMAAISATSSPCSSGRPDRFDQGQLWRHQQAVQRSPAALRGSRRRFAKHAKRAIEAEVAKGCRMLYLRVADESDGEDRGHRAVGEGGTGGGRAGGRGQHLRHADQPEPARSWARTWSSTAPRNSSAATPTRSAARLAARKAVVPQLYHYREINGAALDRPTPTACCAV